MRIILIICFLFFSFLSLNEAATVHKQLNISWFNASPDGYERRVLGFNNQFPGPPIVVNMGDRLIINVTNLSDQLTAVHFHGIYQRNSNEMDGVPGVTQCVIPPGGTFIHDFYVVDQWGTFWYHSHYLAQIVDGMRGAFIVNNNNAPCVPGVSYSSEHIIQLSDWYHNTSSSLLQYYTAPGGSGDEPIPDSILINGLGQLNCTSNCTYETISIPAKSKTRLRIINQSAFGVISFYIEGHTLTVIEVDSVPVSPRTVDVIRINVAQRYSVVVSADGVGGKYKIHATFDQDIFPSPSLYPVAFAYLEYGGIDQVRYIHRNKSRTILSGRRFDGDFNITSDLIDLPTNLHPFPSKCVPKATRQIPLTIDISPNADNVTTAYFNDVSFKGPMGTTLTQLLLASQPFPNTSHVIYLNSNEVVDFVIFNNDTGEHPIHIHGHIFRILGMGHTNDGPWNSSIPLNLNNPLMRDTASVNPGSWLYLRFVSNNPGLWMLHCHIAWHSSVGLGLALGVDTNQLRSRLGAVETPGNCYLEASSPD